MLNRIFDPFVSTKQAVHGVGLGLYVAEGLVRAAGGRITAANNVDAPGACMRIELPAAGPGVSESAIPRDTHRASAGVRP
jgi:C4-dicarboxylate-specific signal transduction histidine kinase